MNLYEILMKLLSGDTTAADRPQPQSQLPPELTQGMGGGSLRDRMLLQQRAQQLSAPGGMGY